MGSDVMFDIDNAFNVINDTYCDEKSTPYGKAYFNKTYKNTNEQLSEYLPPLVKKGSKVLSVAASGDQYLSCIYHGAKEVELFDINPISYYYSMLKICAATHMNYDTYREFILDENTGYQGMFKHMIEKRYIKKIERFLPDDIFYFYMGLYDLVRTMEYPDLNGLFITSGLFANKKRVSFLSEEEYLKLQRKLKRTSYPKFYLGDIEKIISEIDTTYDLILLSNIKDYAGGNFYDRVRNNVLARLNENGVAQMDYVWTIARSHFIEEKEAIDRNNMKPVLFNGVREFDDELYNSQDGILLLKK